MSDLRHVLALNRESANDGVDRQRASAHVHGSMGEVAHANPAIVDYYSAPLRG